MSTNACIAEGGEIGGRWLSLKDREGFCFVLMKIHSGILTLACPCQIRGVEIWRVFDIDWTDSSDSNDKPKRTDKIDKTVRCTDRNDRTANTDMIKRTGRAGRAG